MTQDEMIEMAIKAKVLQPVPLSVNKFWRKDTIRELKAFAKLVAEHEREACAQIAEYKLDNKSLTAPDSPKEWWNHACQNIRNAIRARGKQ
jgi:hypothetical protein